MDTPDKKIQPSPSFLSKFEDSPVFNFISTLSPIKSFSVNHSAQPFHLLSFDSPQPLQTPPTNVPKESKIPRVIHDPGALQDSCRQNVSEGTVEYKSGAVKLAELQNVVDEFDSAREATVSGIDDSSKLVAQLPRSVKYECLSPKDSVVHCGEVKPNCELNMAATDLFATEVVGDVSQEADTSIESEMGMEGCQVDHNKDVCEWEKFIYEGSDTLNCHLSTKEDHHEVDAKNVDSGTLSFVIGVLQTPNDNLHDAQKTESDCPPMYDETHQGVRNPNETSQVPAVEARAVLTEEVVRYSMNDTDDKACPQQQQTTRRRCLMYEMSGSHYRSFVTDPFGGSPSSESAVPSPNSSNKKCLVSSKPGNRNFASLLPGIGLHLNALAATGRDKLIVKDQSLKFRRQLISSSSTMSSFDSLPPDSKVSVTPVSTEENYCNEQNDGTQLNGNACENSTFDEVTEYSQSSPKKKRKKSENSGDADSCKRCNCKRSKCLKLYCECFAAGLYCVEPCNCQDCFNKPAHEDTVLETRRQIESRNPLAFAPKVIRCSSTPSSRDELNKTPASARHKRGCNCKKSGCLKKYCECFQGGVGCSMSCRCEGCKNTFGHKEGTESILLEEAKLLECASDVSSHDNMSKIDDENQETPDPFNNTRQPLRQPFHFGSIPPQFNLIPCRQPQPLQSCPSMINDEPSNTALVEDIKMISNEEASEVMEGDYLLPITAVKSTSPNGKRISPRQCDFKTSPAWKSCRKLILRSIPSFPTIAEEKESTELQRQLH